MNKTQTLSKLSRTTSRIERDRAQRDELIREATRKGATRRQVARAAGLSVGRIQKIVVGALVALALLGACTASAATTPMQAYQRIWKQDRKFYAPGMPSPLVKFKQKMRNAWAETAFPMGHPRFVLVSTDLTRLLSRDPEASRDVLEWEWGRVFGPVWTAQSGQLGWLGGLTNRMAHYRNTGRGNPLRFAQAHLPHWGENPRSIFDPMPPPSSTPATPCPPGYDLELTDGLCYESGAPRPPGSGIPPASP